MKIALEHIINNYTLTANKLLKRSPVQRMFWILGRLGTSARYTLYAVTEILGSEPCRQTPWFWLALTSFTVNTRNSLPLYSRGGLFLPSFNTFADRYFAKIMLECVVKISLITGCRYKTFYFWSKVLLYKVSVISRKLYK